MKINRHPEGIPAHLSWVKRLLGVYCHSETNEVKSKNPSVSYFPVFFANAQNDELYAKQISHHFVPPSLQKWKEKNDFCSFVKETRPAVRGEPKAEDFKQLYQHLG